MASFNTYETGTITARALTTQGLVQIRLDALSVMLSPAEAAVLSEQLGAAAVELGHPVILTGNADLALAG